MTGRQKLIQRDGRKITGRMLDALTLCVQSHQADGGPASLQQFSQRTIRALESLDWIVAHTVDDAQRWYRVTRRGLNAYERYSTATLRLDGVCPRCGIRPADHTKTGKRLGYCRECVNEMSREYYQKRRDQGLRYSPPDTPCPSCGRNPRCISSSGRRMPYCRDCMNRNMRDRRKRRSQRLLEQYHETGKLPLCCKCKRAPVYMSASGTWMYEYCRSCHKEQQHRAARRRSYRTVMTRTGVQP